MHGQQNIKFNRTLRLDGIDTVICPDDGHMVARNV